MPGRRPDTGRPKRGAPTEKRLWTSGGKPARGDRDARRPEPPEDRDPYGIKSVRTRHDDPEIPDEVQAKDLDRVARAQLRTLSKENAEEVARHLAMAARLIEEDPQLAHRHAVSAARRAGRIAVVRETLAITAYSIGDFALALRELRTYRRISGSDDQLPMMVDSERGLGRPDKALELGRSVPRSSLPVAVRVELAIAMSGARLDLGQTETALTELEIPELDPDTAFSYSPGLFDAYATVLEELGRTDEADQWWERSDRATAALMSDEDIVTRTPNRRRSKLPRKFFSRKTTSPTPSRASPTTPDAPSRTPLDGVDLLLADLDGVVYRGALAIPHAVESLNRAAGQARVAYITNNASRTSASVADHLTSLGLTVDADEVVTSPQAAVRLLADLVAAGSTVLVVGGEGIRDELAKAGFRATDSARDHPAAVIQGFAPDVGWTQLAEAAFALHGRPAQRASPGSPRTPTGRCRPSAGSHRATAPSSPPCTPPSAGSPWSPANRRRRSSTRRCPGSAA